MVLFIEVVMSLMHNRNSNGASTVPCVPPEVTECGLLNIPLIENGQKDIL